MVRASVTCVNGNGNGDVNVIVNMKKLRIGENEEMRLYCVGKHTNIYPLESLVSRSLCLVSCGV
jgi:hypothetical protein